MRVCVSVCLYMTEPVVAACICQDDVFAGMDAGHDHSCSNGPARIIIVVEGNAGQKR